MSTTKSDIVRVVDIETTGLDPATDRIVEIAVVVVDFQGQHYRKLFHSLVDPGIPIPPEASAVHHITTAMVAGKAPTPDRIRPALEALADPAIPLAAHNATFDRSFLAAAACNWTSSWICTLRVARHLWPDAPSHGNQALRYLLDLNVPGNEPPHRAMGDALVTAALLVRESKAAGGIERLLELTRQPALLRRVPFRQAPRPALEQSSAGLPRLGRAAGVGQSRSRAHDPGGPPRALRTSTTATRHAMNANRLSVATHSRTARLLRGAVPAREIASNHRNGRLSGILRRIGPRNCQAERTVPETC